jgi:predicted membrane protein
MRYPGQVILGIVVLAFGVVFLIGNLLDVNVWAVCWPTALILLGIGVLFRPQLVGSTSAGRLRLLGDIRRRGEWHVTDEEIWIGIGDVKLDMTQAEIPLGESSLRVLGLVGDVDLDLPPEVGVSVSCNAFVATTRLLGRKRDSILTPVHWVSRDYQVAEKRIRLATTFFVGDIAVYQRV